MGLQYRPRNGRTAKFYAPGRDILGFYRPLHEAVLEILLARYPGRGNEVERLRGMTNIIINEATAGEQQLTMEDFMAAHTEAMQTCAGSLLLEYLALMTSAYTWRYVMGKREQVDDQLGEEEIKKAFEATWIMSILPKDLAKEVERHLLAYGHVPEVAFKNEPPCEAVEVDDAEEDADG